MKCIKCKDEKMQGSIYEAFYGNSSSYRVKTESALEKSRHNVFIDIKGSEKGFICRTCMYKVFLTSALGIGIIAALIIGSIIFAEVIIQEGFLNSLIILGVSLFFIGIIFQPPINRNMFKTPGDNLIIRTHQKEWEQQGFNLFLNRSQAQSNGIKVEQPKK